MAATRDNWASGRASGTVPTRIHPSLTAKLVEAPETGMGYQVLETSVKPDLPSCILVLNAELARGILKGAPPVVVEAEKRLQKKILAALLNTPEKIDFQVLSRPEAFARGLIEMASGKPREEPASEAEPEPSGADEEFLRYSAFQNDRRINADGSVKPNTYVTTYDDGMTHVKTGMDVVRRYALPNPQPAIYRFELAPPSPIQVRRGIVAPAFGQPGGGVEVIFDNGAPPKTLRSMSTIPEGT